jgi:hypothetical protein
MLVGAYLGSGNSTEAWVFLDFVAVSLGFSIVFSKAASRLTPRRPPSSLLSKETVISNFGILLWNFLFLVGAMVSLWNQEWFPCRFFPSREYRWYNVDAYEIEVIYLILTSQIIINSMILNFGYTFREQWFKNVVFAVISIALCSCVLLFTVHPSKFSCLFRINCTNEV